MPVAVRVRYVQPVGSDLLDEALEALLQQAAAPTTKVEVRHLTLAPELAGPMLPPTPRYLNQIVEEVEAAEVDGCDAVVIGCCSDPALAECQRMARIPVVGPLQAAAATAAARGLRLGILFPDEHDWKTTLGWVRGNLRLYGLADVVGPIRFVSFRDDAEPEIIGNTGLRAEDVLARFRRQLHTAAVPAARALLAEDESRAVLFGCTLWGGMVDEVREQVDGLCLDPVVTALRVAELQAGLRGSNPGGAPG